MRHPIAVLLAALATAWAVALTAAPAVGQDAGPEHRDICATCGRRPAVHLAALTYVAGAVVCHQRPERSFHVGGRQMPVCARCAALYWGGAVGGIVWLARRRRAHRRSMARAIAVAAVPVAAGVALALCGVLDLSNGWRAVSSAPLGLVIGAALAAGVSGDLR